MSKIAMSEGPYDLWLIACNIVVSSSVQVHSFTARPPALSLPYYSRRVKPVLVICFVSAARIADSFILSE